MASFECVVAEEHRSLCIFFEYDQDAAIRHKVDRRSRHVYDLHRLRSLHARRNINQQAVLCEERIQRRHAIIALSGCLIIEFFEQFGALSRHIHQRIDDDALRQSRRVVRCGRHGIIYHIIIPRTKMLNRAAVSLIRIYFQGNPFKIQAEVGRESRLHICIFVALRLRRRQTFFRQQGSRFFAPVIHRGARAGADQRLLLLIERQVLFFARHNQASFRLSSIHSKPRSSIS